jgi:ribosomal protein L11 methyltransferase
VNIHIWQADSLENIKGAYDVILANINRNILLQYMADMRRLLSPGGVLLLSGIMVQDEKIILENARKQGLQRQQQVEQDNWLAIKLVTE